jgi:hypothetical protein
LQSPKDSEIVEQYTRLVEEAATLRVEVAIERQKRMAAEAIAEERQKQIDRETERALGAEKSRDEVLKMIYTQNVAAQSEKSQLDPRNYKPIQRQRRVDPWFDQKFMGALEKIRRGEKVEVPEPPAEAPVQ